MYTMELSPYSEQFTIACNHSWEPAGEGSGCCVLRGFGQLNQLEVSLM